MPKVFPNNTRWERNGRLNQKRHIDMTDEEKSNVAKCDGLKQQHPCKNPVFRCSECGNYGCAQEVAEKCSKQGFKNDKCLHCGAMNSRIPVMQEDLDTFVQEWEKEI